MGAIPLCPTAHWIQNTTVRRIQREPVAESVTRRIRAAILSGDLSPGTRIRQEELAALLAVSRAPVRQALVVLERERLVQTDRCRGTIVAPLDVDLVRDQYQFRGAIERDVAATLAAKATRLKIAGFRDIITAGQEATRKADTGRLLDLDVRFHTALYDATGNRVVRDVMSSQWIHVRRVMGAALTIPGYPEQVWREHEAIVDAIEAREPLLAATRAGAHTEAASRHLQQIVAERVNGAAAAGVARIVPS
jgi:DNA-binding GntR family transcriptional regulator